MSIQAPLAPLAGLNATLFASYATRAEEAMQTGQNRAYTVLFQLLQNHCTLWLIGRLFITLQWEPLSFTVHCMSYCIPPLLTWISQEGSSPTWVRHFCFFLHRHLGTFYHTVSLIIVVALLYLGHTFFASIAITILILGFFERHFNLPSWIQEPLSTGSTLLQMGSGLLIGNIINQTFLMLNGIAYLIRASLRGYHCVSASSRTAILTPSLLKKYLDRHPSLQMNPNAFHTAPIVIPPLNSEDFIEQEFTFSKNDLYVFRLKLLHDSQFIEQHHSPDALSDGELITYLHNRLRDLCHSLETPWRQRVQHILHMHSTDAVIRTDMLFQLAIDGHGICKAGQYEVIENLYTLSLNRDTPLSCTDRILTCLQSIRTTWCQQRYSEAVGFYVQKGIVFQVGKLIEWQELHSYHTFLHTCDLENRASDENEFATLGPLFTLLLSPLQNTIHAQFLADLTQGVIDAIGTPLLPKPEVYLWWKEWIERQHLSGEETKGLLQELSQGSLYGHPFEEEGKFKASWIGLMLLEMGILMLDKDPESEL